MPLESIDMRASLFPLGVVYEEETPCLSFRAMLSENEAKMVDGAVESRVKQFSAGRHLAKRAAKRMNMQLPEILRDENRAPIWPTEVVGSITHTKGFAAAALAPASQFRALGIDAEANTPLKEKLWDSVCVADELSWLKTRINPHLDAKIIFSAKEAAYKAQYHLSKTYLWFPAMRIEFDKDESHLRAHFLKPAADIFKPGDYLEGRVHVDANIVFCAFFVR